MFGEGPIKRKLVKSGIKFEQEQMFLMANNHNFDEEKITKEESLEEQITKPQKRTTGQLKPRIKGTY